MIEFSLQGEALVPMESMPDYFNTSRWTSKQLQAKELLLDSLSKDLLCENCLDEHFVQMTEIPRAEIWREVFK